MPDAESVYLFRHALVRDAAYGLFLPAERVDLHRAAIGSFEKLFADGLDTHAEELLQHARSGLAQDEGDGAEGLRELEYRYLKLAADFCAQGWRVSDELRYLQELETHTLATNGERAAFMTRRASHLVEGADLAEAEEVADAAYRAASEAGDTAQKFSASYIRYRARYERGRVSPGELDTLVAEMEQHGPSEPLMQLQIEQGITNERAGESVAAEVCFDRAVETARRVPGQLGEGDSLIERGVFLHRHGDTARGEKDIQAALDLARKTGNKRLELQALNRLGILQVESRRSTQAGESYSAALKLANELGARASAVIISNNYANLNFFFLGNISSAEAEYLESLEFFAERGEVHSIAHCNGVLGLMYVAAGEFESAKKCFRTVQDSARMQHDKVMEAKAAMGLAMSTFEDTEFLGAFRLAFDQLNETPSGSNQSRLWAVLADTLLERGYVKAAGDAADRALHCDRVAPQAPVTKLRHQLIAGDAEGAIVPEGSLPPDRAVSEALLFRLMHAARMARASEVQAIQKNMRELAATFEAARFRDVRQALALAEATVRAHENGETDLWRGIPFSVLPTALAKSLRSPGADQSLEALLQRA